MSEEAILVFVSVHIFLLGVVQFMQNQRMKKIEKELRELQVWHDVRKFE